MTSRQGEALARRGQPTALTPEVERVICSAVRQGLSIEGAAELAGVGRSTAYGWFKRGAEDPEGPYGPFVVALAQAQAAFEASALGHISAAAAEGTWQAAAWLLERRLPRRWGRQERGELTTEAGDAGDEPPPTPEQLRAMSDDELARYEANLTAKNKR